MYFLLNLNHYVKSYGHLCQILAFFTMPAFQIWPCHVTQEANFEKILPFPNSAFNIRKSYKISSRKTLYFRSYQPKTSLGGGKHPPPGARSEFWGWQAVPLGGGVTVMEKREILAGWVTKICLKCTKKLGWGGRVTFDNIFKSSRDIKQ